MDLQLTLDWSRRVPLSIQVAHGIRDAIFTRRLLPGSRLPPTRKLAQRLQVSRMVVVEAYEWLIAEGYVEARQGSGSYVSHSLTLPHQHGQTIADPPYRTDSPPEKSVIVDFRPGVPALDLFPRRAWRTSLARALRDAPIDQLGYGPVEGVPRLRRVIAEYISRTRGLPVAPEQLVITVGAAQASDLMLRTLAPVHSMVIEEPNPEPVHRLLRLHHIQPVPIPVDDGGLRVDLLRSSGITARVVHVVPSHHYPTGVAMRLDRRLDLLDWAEQHDAVILEDDYDSEFRFDQAPVTALAALNPSGQVIYIGSFSKTMFPGLRLGFCVVPERFIKRFLELKWFSDRCVPILEQLALAEWLESGIFERHVRKMRTVYARRRQALVAALTAHFGDRIDIRGIPAGVHLLARFRHGIGESELVAAALQAGIKVYPASLCYSIHPPEDTSIILGYGNLPEATIARGVSDLARVISRLWH